MDASNMMAKTTTFETFRQHQSDDLIESISSASDDQKLERLDKRTSDDQRKHARKHAACDASALSMTKEYVDSTLIATTIAPIIPPETDTQSTTKNKRKNFKPRSTAITDGQNETNLLDMRMQNSINNQRQQHRTRSQDISSSVESSPSTIIIDPSSHPKNNENRLDLESCGNYTAAVGRKLVHISNSLSPTTLLNSLTELSHGSTTFEAASIASEPKMRLKSLKTALHSQNHHVDTDGSSSLPFPVWPPTSASSSSSALNPQHFTSNAFTAVQDLLSVYGLSMSPNDIVDAFNHRAEASAICDLANNGKFFNRLCPYVTLSVSRNETSFRVHNVFSWRHREKYAKRICAKKKSWCRKKTSEKINRKSKIKCHQFYSL